jgi:hypothetical protein
VQLTEKISHFESMSEQLQNTRCDLEGYKKQCEEESRRAWTAEKDKDRLTAEVLAREGELARYAAKMAELQRAVDKDAGLRLQVQELQVQALHGTAPADRPPKPPLVACSEYS